MADPSDAFAAVADDEQIRRERARARELRRSQWWKRQRAKGTCHYCGGQFAPQTLTMDHILPLVRGGRSTKGNVVPACKACNTGKKHRLAWELTPLPERSGLPFESGVGLSLDRMLGDTKNALGFHRSEYGSMKTKRNSAKR